jgi:hypothetical protein
MDIDNLYCINTTKDIYLQGSFGQPEWTYLNFEFNKCINSSENNNSCLPENEMNSVLDGGYVGLFVTDFSVYPNDYKNPLHLYGKNIFTGFSVREYLDCWIYLRPIVINTDNGFIINRINSKSSFQYESIKETKDHRGGNNFLTVKLRLDQSKDIYDRSYTKLHETLADFGGIIKVCWVLGEIAAYFFREMLFKDYLLSFFFEKFKNTGEGGMDSPEINRTISRLSFNPRKKSSLKNKHLPNHTTNTSMLNSLNNSPLPAIKRKRVNSIYSNLGANNVKNNFTDLALGVNMQPNFKNSSQDFLFKYDSDTNNIKIDSFIPPEKNERNNHKKINNFIAKKNTNGHNETLMSTDKKNKYKLLRYKRKLNLFLLIGPCLFNAGIRKTTKEINDKFQRILYWFDVIQYLKLNSDLMYMKQQMFDKMKLVKIKNKYIFELANQEELNIFNNKIQSSMKLT